jgi:hypothetical protein
MALGLGLGLAKHSSYVLGSGFDPDYQAVLDYATANAIPLPDDAQKAEHNQRVLDWKASGFWSTRDFIFNFEGSNGSFALIDWKRLVMATAINSPTYDATKGFASNGTTSYIDLNYNPATFGGQWSINNGGVLSKYVGDVSFSATQRAICIGASAGAYTTQSYAGTTLGTGRLGETSAVFTTAIGDARGTHTICATKDASNRTVYIDAVSRSTVGITPALPSNALFSLREQTNYAPNNLFHVSVLLGGGGITAQNATDFHNSVV